MASKRSARRGCATDRRVPGVFHLGNAASEGARDRPMSGLVIKKSSSLRYRAPRLLLQRVHILFTVADLKSLIIGELNEVDIAKSTSGTPVRITPTPTEEYLQRKVTLFSGRGARERSGLQAGRRRSSPILQDRDSGTSRSWRSRKRSRSPSGAAAARGPDDRVSLKDGLKPKQLADAKKASRGPTSSSALGPRNYTSTSLQSPRSSTLERVEILAGLRPASRSPRDPTRRGREGATPLVRTERNKTELQLLMISNPRPHQTYGTIASPSRLVAGSTSGRGGDSSR